MFVIQPTCARRSAIVSCPSRQTTRCRVAYCHFVPGVACIQDFFLIQIYHLLINYIIICKSDRGTLVFNITKRVLKWQLLMIFDTVVPDKKSLLVHWQYLIIICIWYYPKLLCYATFCSQSWLRLYLTTPKKNMFLYFSFHIINLYVNCIKLLTLHNHNWKSDIHEHSGGFPDQEPSTRHVRVMSPPVAL